MLGTAETPYDLRFRLLDIPVRIHPMFWLISAVLGWRDGNLPAVVLWVACVFVSILVHEYGHALTARAFGSSPSVVLWGLGGLCYSQSDRQTPAQRIAVLLGGPGAGFLLAAAVMVVYSVVFGIAPREHVEVAASLVGLHVGGPAIAPSFHSVIAASIYVNFIWINVMWGLVNLLPVWPLDGGQIAEVILSQVNRYKGTRWAHVISLVCAGCLAVATYYVTQELYYSIFFASFALINYQVLHSLHQAQATGLYSDDEWWRR
jgi:stage IV sporulation protein FB